MDIKTIIRRKGSKRAGMELIVNSGGAVSSWADDAWRSREALRGLDGLGGWVRWPPGGAKRRPHEWEKDQAERRWPLLNGTTRRCRRDAVSREACDWVDAESWAGAGD